jgi:acyl-CoA thioesterase I
MNFLPIRSLVAGTILAFLTISGSLRAAEVDSTKSTSTHGPKILAIGDSMLAWHKVSGRSIGDVVSQRLNAEIVDHSIAAARFNYALPITGAFGLNIAKQYRPGGWDWVIMNGGGNDLWFGCGCVACDVTIDKMISKDGLSGKIPNLVARILNDGARVIFVGYLHSPGVSSIIDQCKNQDVEFEQRLTLLSRHSRNFLFLPVSGLVPYGDRSFHSLDMIHPSVKGSAVIGRKLAEIIWSSR